MEAKVLFEQWKQEYNQIRPRSSLGYRPPALEVIMSVTTTLQVVRYWAQVNNHKEAILL